MTPLGLEGGEIRSTLAKWRRPWRNRGGLVFLRRRVVRGPPDIPGPPRFPHRGSLQDLFTRPLWEISIQDPLISLNLLILFIGALYKIPSQDLYERYLYKSSLQDLFTRPPWEISLQELSTRSLHRTPYETSLNKSSQQDLFTGPPNETSLRKSSLQDLFTGPPYETSLYKSSWNPWTS